MCGSRSIYWPGGSKLYIVWYTCWYIQDVFFTGANTIYKMPGFRNINNFFLPLSAFLQPLRRTKKWKYTNIKVQREKNKKGLFQFRRRLFTPLCYFSSLFFPDPAPIENINRVWTHGILVADGWAGVVMSNSSQFNNVMELPTDTTMCRVAYPRLKKHHGEIFVNRYRLLARWALFSGFSVAGLYRYTVTGLLGYTVTFVFPLNLELSPHQSSVIILTCLVFFSKKKNDSKLPPL